MPFLNQWFGLTRDTASALIEGFRRSFHLPGPQLVVKVHVHNLKVYDCYSSA